MAIHINDLIEDKARGGDGLYAIAYALLQLTVQQKATAKALQEIGVSESIDHPGALEKIAIELTALTQTLAERD
ncbi:hypothetical protein [Terrihabitans sp. B22-R8]|uniref:hypothetical protein n=1 Tax=Terrihabitans sp. B22-R8 TaxID=3425128 RepID=UPI00403C7154